MFKAMGRLFATLAVCFGATLAFHACSDSNGGIVVNLTPLFDAANLRIAMSNACENGGGCDGVVPDPETYEVFIDTAVGGENYLIIIGGTSFGITASESVVGTIDAQLIACINNGTSEVDGDPTCTQTNGSTVATATQGSVIVTADDPLADGDPFEDFTFSVSAPGSEGEISFMDNTTQDLISLVSLFDGIIEPNAQEVVDQAVTDGLIDVPNGMTQTVTVTGVQEIDCDNDGRLVVSNTYVVEIDDDEQVTGGPSLEGWSYSFQNCELTGDILNDGSSNESITLNGAQVGGYNDDTGVEQNSGTITLVTDDGTGTPFWTDRVSINVQDNDGDPNGGVCLGAGVVLGPTNTTDTDDDCAAGGDVFIPAGLLP